MHFIVLLALVLPIGAVSSRSEEAKRASPTCGTPGWNLATTAYFYKQDPPLATPEKCGARCLKESKCQSYAVGKGVCMHFTVTTERNLRKDTRSPYNFFDRACVATSTSSRPNSTPSTTPRSCEVRGYDKNKPKAFFYTTAPSSRTKTGCAALCRAKPGCKSFAVGNGACLLYTCDVASNFTPAPKSPYVFWDVSCPLTSSPSPSPTPSTYISRSTFTSLPSTSTLASSTPRSTGTSTLSNSAPVSTASTSSRSSFSSTSTISSLSTPTISVSSAPFSSSATSSISSTSSYSTFSIHSTSSSYPLPSSSSLDTQLALSTLLNSASGSQTTTSPSAGSSVSSLSSTTILTSSSPGSISSTGISSASTGSVSVSVETLSSPSGSTRIAPSSTSSTQASSAPTSSATPTPTPSTSPSSSVAPYSYSYDDYALPTVTRMGTAPLSEGVSALAAPPGPTLPCLVDPSKGSAAQFKILARNGIPIVQKTGNLLGPFPKPATEAEAIALGPVENLDLSTYYFEKNPAVSGDLYDLVLASDPPQYLAFGADGSVILYGSSTGVTPIAGPQGNDIVTSVFNINCKGEISASFDNSPLLWVVAGDVTEMRTSPSTLGMLALPVAPPTASRRHRRQNQSTSGVAPRCPNTPPNIFAKVRPGARPENPNGCGPNNGMNTAPAYDFQSCCNRHDVCFDNCEQGVFEQCNSDFHTCMSNEGCGPLNSPSTFDSYVACRQLADYYASVLVSDSVRNLFYQSNQERCGCFCSNTEGLCPSGGGSYQCTNLFAQEHNNCGACGRICEAKTRCSGGTCVCANDQCGDRCVNFLTHPSHCGSCNNVCSTGFCSNGICTTPPSSSPTCSAGEGVRNGQFATDFSTWTYFYDTAASPIVPLGRAADSAVADGFSLYVDPPATYAPTGVLTELRLCSGVNYELTFQMRREAAGPGCNVGIFVGNSRRIFWDTTRPPATSMTSWGPYSIGSFTAMTPGAGVRVDGVDLYVPFQLILQCQGGGPQGGGGRVRFDAFSVTPF